LTIPFATLLLALAASQTTGADAISAAEDGAPADDRGDKTGDPDAWADRAFGPASETGIPFFPTASSRPQGRSVATLGFGVMSQLRAWTLDTGGVESTTWATDLEVTPGVTLDLVGQSVELDLGYAARLTVPFNTVGASFAALQRAYATGQWELAPLWTLSVAGAFTFGDYSQLIPVATPGGPALPSSGVNPIRTFSTYPYLGLQGSLRLAVRLSPRARLRLSAGYVDVGGTGTEGQVAQPRTWGPVADAFFDWELSP
jgi:hypothetical protein